MDCDKRMDIFPRYVSTHVEKLTYPKKNFENFKNEGHCRIFIMYLDKYRKMYYYKLDWTEQYFSHMLNVGRESQTCKDFHPERINWSNVANRFQKCTSQTLRKNTDGRIGFKNGDKYLVKAYFTFGQRTVPPGLAHVVQTLNVPLVFYLMPENARQNMKLRDGLFPDNHIHLYDRRVLLPHGCYRIPPGTTYVLMSTQKNFFSLNVIDATDVFSIPHVDPVSVRVQNLVGMYDVPPQTPYIEDVVDEDDQQKNPALEALFKSIAPPREEFVVPVVTPVEPQTCEPVFYQDGFVKPREPVFYHDESTNVQQPIFQQDGSNELVQQTRVPQQPVFPQQPIFQQDGSTQQTLVPQTNVQQQPVFPQQSIFQQDGSTQQTLVPQTNVQQQPVFQHHESNGLEQQTRVPQTNVQQQPVFQHHESNGLERQTRVPQTNVQHHELNGLTQFPQSMFQHHRESNGTIHNDSEPMERNVVIAHPDFVTNYQRLMWMEVKEPTKTWVPNGSADCQEPLDLTAFKFPDVQFDNQLDMDESMDYLLTTDVLPDLTFDDILSELYESAPL